jgi:hypothetical protein
MYLHPVLRQEIARQRHADLLWQADRERMARLVAAPNRSRPWPVQLLHRRFRQSVVAAEPALAVND